ncbi:hypothetical protein EDD17DRAFT_1677449, partial [Pisolithus thermaeus]
LRRVATWKVGALLYLLNRLSGAVWSLLATSGNDSSEDDVDESLPNSGLFTYPVLQAMDILV